MDQPIDTELAQQWSGCTPDLFLRWTWFQPAFGMCMHRQGAQLEQAFGIDEAALGRAFLAWARMVEDCAPFVRLDPVDHAHFLCGRLLSCLFAESPLHTSSTHRAQAKAGTPGLWPEGQAQLVFVCTLLQTWREGLGQPPLDWDAQRFRQHGLSFRENVSEDPNRAGPFLDFFMGLEPVWEYAHTISRRPAMQRAQALHHPSSMA